MSLQNSVGAGGTNLRSDVRWVQRKLNHAIDGRKIHIKRLAEDGLCGPRTISAIRQFQLVFVAQLPTGRVDPRSGSASRLGQFARPRRANRFEMPWKVEEGDT